MKKKVALIGYGALGQILVDALLDKLSEDYQVAGVWTRSIDKHKSALASKGVPAYDSFEDLLGDDSDYVVEIASVSAVADYGLDILSSGKNLIISSVGALSDADLQADLAQCAKNHGKKVYVTSGAIGGFDIFQAISLMGGAEGVIHTRKAPRSLEGAPYLEDQSLPQDQAQVVFDGTAEEAIQGFPQNVNVAVASALASVGTDQMQTIIESVPDLSANSHQLTVKNDRVRADLKVTSQPDPQNSKSSVVTAWSVAALLKNLASPIELF